MFNKKDKYEDEIDLTKDPLDYSQFQLDESIRFKNLNIEGLNANQLKKQQEKERLANETGEIVYEIFTGVNPDLKIEPNVDYKLSEMSQEQREVYEALQMPDDVIYEEIEDDFILIANDGSVPLKKKEELREEIMHINDVEMVKGDKLDSKTFLDIVNKDAIEFGLTKTGEKDGSEEEDIEEGEIEDVDPNDIDIVEMMMLNKPVKKGMEVVEQKIETVQGGGKLIFRKIKKKKQSVAFDMGDEEPLIEIVSDSDDCGKDKLTQTELERLEARYQELKAAKNMKPIPMSEESDSESDREVEVMDMGGEKLIKYTKRKKKVKRSKYNFKEDLVLQQAVYEDDDKIDIENRSQIRNKNLETCPTAPNEYIKHTNYYCMNIVKEDLDVTG